MCLSALYGFIDGDGISCSRLAISMTDHGQVAGSDFEHWCESAMAAGCGLGGGLFFVEDYSELRTPDKRNVVYGEGRLCNQKRIRDKVAVGECRFGEEISVAINF